MASFVRFVFVVLIVGMVVNLGVVMLANARSQQQQARNYQQAEEQYRQFLEKIGRVEVGTSWRRRVDIIVKEQRSGDEFDLDARKTIRKVRESSLLVRQYQDPSGGQGMPLPIVRVSIPGDKLQVGGVVLDFDANFEGPNGEYRMLAGKRLPLFGLLCGADEKAPANLQVEDERFTLFPRDIVPALVRLDPLARQPTYFELKLWQYLWKEIPELPRDMKYPWTPAGTGRMKATWLPPEIVTLERDHVYSAYVYSTTRTMTVVRDDISRVPNLADRMLEEDKQRELDEEKPQ